MPKLVADISVSLDGFVAGPDPSLEEPWHRRGAAARVGVPPCRVATSFTFVTDGVEGAVERARAAAGDKDVAIAGGASVIQQCLAAELLDDLSLHIAPVLLGGGVRLFEGVPTQSFEIKSVTQGSLATHVRYRVRHDDVHGIRRSFPPTRELKEEA